MVPKMVDVVRITHDRNRNKLIPLDNDQLTELVMIFASRLDQLETVALASPDGEQVDLVGDLAASLIKGVHSGQTEEEAALARHEITEHTEDLRAQQHVRVCECGETYMVSDDGCPKCGVGR